MQVRSTMGQQFLYIRLSVQIACVMFFLFCMNGDLSTAVMHNIWPYTVNLGCSC